MLTNWQRDIINTLVNKPFCSDNKFRIKIKTVADINKRKEIKKEQHLFFFLFFVKI